MNVLVVDDSKAIFLVVEGMLQESNMKLIWAQDGIDAITKLSSDEINLILLDWNMPNMDGLEFLKKNREDKITKAPIIMMTAVSRPSKLRDALDLGALECIIKPFSEESLKEILQKYII